MLEIITYNINGIRAAVNKGLVDWIKNRDPDIICFQELKANEEDIPKQMFEELGYHGYWFSAQKKGYSGVGVISKVKPSVNTKGNEFEQSNYEGRVITLEYPTFILINAYFPSGSLGGKRQAYKYQWLDEFLVYVKSLQKQYTKPLVICGDYNICHQSIDIHDPIRNVHNSGFLPEERAWMTKFFNEANIIDSFRSLHPEQKDAYTWWSFRANARNKNKGWRIDYISLSSALQSQLKQSAILADIKHSDHCPMLIELDV